MKTFQNLEIGSSFIVFLTALGFFYMETFFELNNPLDQISTVKIIFEEFMFYIFPALLLIVGAYLHIIKKSYFGLFLLFLGGIFSITISIITLLATLVAHHRYGWSGSLIAILFGFFAASTICCALFTRKFPPH